MRTINVAGLMAGLITAALVVQGAAADREVRAGDLVIQQPWARATPGGAAVAGGYLVVVNHGQAPERLTGVSLEAAANAELHEMTSRDNVMQMRPTGPLAIPAGGTLTLSPAGTHIMFTGLRRGFKKGETIPGTLTFEHAGPVPVVFAIEGIGAKQPSGAAGSAMPGMTMD